MATPSADVQPNSTEHDSVSISPTGHVSSRQAIHRQPARRGLSAFAQHSTDTTIGLGHVICDNLAQGYTKSDLADSLQRNLPKLSRANDQYIVDQAAAAYCPWYR